MMHIYREILDMFVLHVLILKKMVQVCPVCVDVDPRNMGRTRATRYDIKLEAFVFPSKLEFLFMVC